MEVATTKILQSKFFNPAFNTAIFDGQVRMYFAQHQEPEALKVYCQLQNLLKDEGSIEARGNVFLMLYPNRDLFIQSFDNDIEVAVERLDQDIVIGVQGPISDNVQNKVIGQIEFMLSQREFA